MTGKEALLGKLIEIVARFTGMYFTRGQLRKQAEVEAYRVKQLALAVHDTNNLGVKVKYERDGLQIEPDPERAEEQSLLWRAIIRTQYQEALRQHNLERVLDYTAQTIEQGDIKPQEIEKDVDEDWLASFFEKAPLFSSEQMQMLWAKVLAGEILTPGSFSHRTLETLKVINVSEARLFERLASYTLREVFAGPYVFNNGEAIVPIASGNEMVAQLSHDQIVKLVDAGLIGGGGNVITATTQKLSFKYTKAYQWGSKAIVVVRDAELAPANMNYYVLTDVGKELLNVAEVITHESALQTFVQALSPSASRIYLSENWSLLGDSFEYKVKQHRYP